MKFLTIQHKDVLDKILENSRYNPNFQYSNINTAGAKEAYDIILKIYKEKNNLPVLDGLIFGFNNISKDEFYDMTVNLPEVAKAFNFYKEDYSILELEIPDTINTTIIDFNGFIGLMEDVKNTTSTQMYKELFGVPYLKIRENIIKGLYINKIYTLLSRYNKILVLQSHYHQILLNEIVGVYPMIDLNRNKFKLNSSASKLLKLL